ncbi:hypothetical protein [Chromobacterium subtsugae]|uniref:hypothetical protein n=1 Tax=Chromobacterium subtsugae TaxID=251747 RepID=UPI000A86382A|nr:hypothetical protein [Chromobacterium subtsugae]
MLIFATSGHRSTVMRASLEVGQAASFSQQLDAAKSTRFLPAQANPPAQLNLKSVTTEEAYDVLSGLANTGKLSSEEFQNLMPTIYIRLLNEQQGPPQAERFDLLADTQSLMESSKAFGTLAQVRAERSGLEALKAYQGNR